MQRKSNPNGGKGRKKPVKKQMTFDELNEYLLKKSQELNQEPTLQEQIEQNLRAAEENRKAASLNIRKSELVSKMLKLSMEAPINFSEFWKALDEYQKLLDANTGIEPYPNHCKTCLFKKLCPKFTADGRNGLSCDYPAYQKEMMETCKKGSGWISYNQRLVYWHDTQEQLDKRFNLS